MITRLPPNSQVRFEMIDLLHHVALDLAKWLHGQFYRHSGENWWSHHVCGIGHENDQQRIVNGEWGELQDMDLGALLNVLIANRRFLLAKRAFLKQDVDTIFSMKSVRVRCEGHWPVNGLPVDEIETRLNAMARFGSLIGSGKSLKEKVDSLAQKLRTSSNCEDTDSITQVETQPVVQSLEAIDTVRLVEYFKGEHLTSCQASAVDALQRFIDDPDQHCFILKGYAGTGKDFIIGGLARYLHSLHRQTIIMAPTGRAAYALRERHKVVASTIHRHIYEFSSMNECKEIEENGSVDLRLNFNLKSNEIESDAVFIVNEASMISDLDSESESLHFGSGRLLMDLIDYMNFNINDYKNKLILIGDDAQIAPHGMSPTIVPPALDEDYLRKKFLVSATTCETTEVLSQAKSSMIIKNATCMRNILTTGRYTHFDFKSDGEKVRELKSDEFVPEFVREWHNAATMKPVIVTYTNQLSKYYNDDVRRILFPGSQSITRGDQIMVVRATHTSGRVLFNGQIGIVTELEEDTETRDSFLNVGEGKIEVIKLVFRKVTLRFDDEIGGYFDLSCKIFENCLLNSNNDIHTKESKALFADFKQRHRHLKPSQPEFMVELKSDPYYNAVMLKFGYAMTCHKAQGGEWPTVFVDFLGMKELGAEMIRLGYTAVSRATESLVTINALHQPRLKPRKPRVGATTQRSAALDGINRDFPASLDIQPSIGLEVNLAHQSKSEIIRILVEKRLPQGWIVKRVRSSQYQERFELAVQDRFVSATIRYNGKDCISGIEIISVSGQDKLDQQTKVLLDPLKGFTIGSGGNEAEEILSCHINFVEDLREEYANAKVEIVRIKSHDEYKLEARLRVGYAEGSVSYDFKGSGCFESYRERSGCPIEILERIDLVHV